MSRVGKLPVKIPSGVVVKVNGNSVSVNGPKGSISKAFAGNIKIEVLDDSVVVRPLDDEKFTRAMWGTTRSIIDNMVEGTVKGFSVELEISGVGYRANIIGGYLHLQLGMSHTIKIQIPSDIKLEVPRPTLIILSCVDKEKLGMFADLIFSQRPVEPYKGAGIKYKGRFVFRKEGKKG